MSPAPSPPDDRIKAYYQDHPASTQSVVGPAHDEATTASAPKLHQHRAHLTVEEPTPATEEEQIRALRRDFLYGRGLEVIQRSREKRQASQ